MTNLNEITALVEKMGANAVTAGFITMAEYAAACGWDDEHIAAWVAAEGDDGLDANGAPIVSALATITTTTPAAELAKLGWAK
jgi:hypothetical protein